MFRSFTNKTSLRAFGLLVASLVTVGSVRAQLSGASLLPGDRGVAPALGNKDELFIATGAGQYLAVYEDLRAMEGPAVGGDPWEVYQTDLYATRLAPNGSVMDTSPIVVDSSPFSQEFPAAAFNGTDYLVAFESRGPTVSGFSTTRNINAVRVSGSGQVLDAIPLAVDSTDLDVFAPIVGSDGLNWVVIWTNGRDLLGCVVDAVGNVGPRRTLVASAFVFDMSIAWAQDRYLLAWEGGIRAQLFDAALNSLSTVKVVSTSADDIDPVVSTDGSSFFVSWIYNSIRPAIRGTYVSLTGTVRNRGGVLIDGGAEEASSGPGLAWNGSEYVVAWRESEFDLTAFAYRDHVVYNRVNIVGQPIGPGPTEVSGSLDYQSWHVRAASLGQGDTFVGWLDQRIGTRRHFGGQGTLIDAAGTFGPVNPFTVAPRAQLTPDLALGPEGAAPANDINLAVFVSADAAERRVVFQRLDGNGVALDAEPVVLAGGVDTYSHTAVAWNGSLWLVVWSESLIARPSGQILGTRVLPDGTILDATPFVIVSGHTPDVAALGSDFLVVSSSDATHESRSIRGMRVRGSDGALLGTGSIFIGSNYSLMPSVAAIGGRWLVAWNRHSTHDSPSTTMQAAFVEANGVPQPAFSPTQVNLRENSADLVVVNDVATLAWSDREHIRLRQILSDGTLLGPPDGVIAVTGNPIRPTIAWDGSKYAVASVDYRNQFFAEPDLGDLYGTRVSGALSVVEPQGLPLAANSRQPEGEAAIAGRDGVSLVLHPAIDDGLGNWRISVARWVDWSDQGFGLAGTHGVPKLDATGLLIQNETIRFHLGNALASTFGFHIVGVNSVFANFRGGTLVPAPDLLVPIFTDANGEADLSFALPNNLPAGVQIFVQTWVSDAAGPLGAAASQGYRAAAP